MKIKEKDKVNGGLYDRGTADSYYGRSAKPHYYPHGTYNGKPVTGLSNQQTQIYMAGYDWNEINGDFKDWGDKF